MTSLSSAFLRVFTYNRLPYTLEPINEIRVNTSTHDDPPGTEALHTWKASDGMWVTLAKLDHKNTWIYIHETGYTYIANNLACLNKRCPAGTRLLAQMVIDGLDNDMHQPSLGCSNCNIMVFDIISFGLVSMEQRTPIDRYGFLREHADDIFAGNSICKPNWARMTF